MKETYHIGQINVGQNFCRIKLFVGQNFRHLRKVSSLLSYGISSLLSTFVRKFCPFSKFEITLKNSIRYFFRDSLFLYHKNKKNIHIFYFSTIMLNSISLSSINGGFLFLFTFGQITSKQSSSTSSSSESRICGSILFFLVSLPHYPHHPLLWFQLLLCLELMFHRGSETQIPRSKVEQKSSWFSSVLSIGESWKSTSEVFLILLLETAKDYTLWRKLNPQLFGLLLSINSRQALQFPWEISGQIGKISGVFYFLFLLLKVLCTL